MAENQSFVATTFSQLLFASDHHDIQIDKNYSVSDSSSSFAIENPPKMLCFGSKTDDEQHPHQPQLVFNSRLACSDSSSTSSGNAIKKTDSKLKRRNGSNSETAAIKAAPLLNQKASKKIKADAPSSAGHAKRKEKLGERISALQQLVSPFGKSDTASVLHEAMGYIKFLHEQVQVLCSPYLQQNQLFSSQSVSKETEPKTDGDLQNRGLCLIPVECSLHLANCTVADFWSPSMAMGKKL